MTFLAFIVTWMVLIFVGIPIAVSMILVSVGYFLYTGIGIGFAAQRIVDGLNSFPIIAVPLFILAANIFNSSSITKNLFGFATHLVGHIRGGLGHVNILASLFFSGMSGSGWRTRVAWARSRPRPCKKPANYKLLPWPPFWV